MFALKLDPRRFQAGFEMASSSSGSSTSTSGRDAR
jgi:hypothetical protein